LKYQVEEISKQIKREKTIKKIFKTILLAFLIMLLIVNVMMQYQKKIKNAEIPQIAGLSVFNIVSESMEPTINVNDLIVIKKCTQEEIRKDDIITYKRGNGSVVTHRIVKIGKENGENVYVTKGDNNPIEDDEAIKYSRVYGKYLFKINGVGKIVEELQKNNGLISVALLLIIFIILKNGSDKKKENRKKIREKYDLKKKRDEYNKKEFH
jgi:signal peptidase